MSLDQLPPQLQAEWAASGREGIVKVALQDAFLVLFHLEDPLGRRFRELGLDQHDRSPLMTRNASILAHGFQPVGERVHSQLWNAALQLAELSEDVLPRFPHIGETLLTTNH